MGYLSVIDISGSGMEVERVRMDLTALNLANVHTTRSQAGGPYRPLSLLTKMKVNPEFDRLMNSEFQKQAPGLGVEIDEIRELRTTPKIVYEPNHPDANKQGYVAYPDINPVSEMVNMISITRSFEANVRALNAAKSMIESAMNIGGN